MDDSEIKGFRVSDFGFRIPKSEIRNPKPVRAFTRHGKFILFLLRFPLTILHWIKGKDWHIPPLYFHEDPRHFTLKDLLFFAYKYYFKPPIIDDAEEKVVDFFQNHPPHFGCTMSDVGCTMLDVHRTSDIVHDNIVHELTITAAGDLMPYEWIQKHYCSHLWDDIADDFFNSDIIFANLETPIDIMKPVSLVPEVMLNDMNFNGDEKMFDVFRGNDFTVLSTANNHSLDMGETGVLETIAFLENKNVLYTGTARSEEERLNYPVVETQGIRVAFIAYTFSMNKYTNPVGKPYLVNHFEVNQPNIDLTSLKNDIFHAKMVRKADIVVLSLHYGNAYQAYPGAHIVDNTKRIFEECGVDIILGGHAHNVQPMARYDFQCPFTHQAKQGFVLFAFGDFVAYDIFTWGHLSVYLKLKIRQNTVPPSHAERDGANDTHRDDDGANTPSSQRHDRSVKGGVKTTFLQEVMPVPVYTCGIYKNKNDRDLRLLDAEKTLKLIGNGEIPPFMTSENVEELKTLMAFYKTHFAKNLIKKLL